MSKLANVLPDVLPEILSEKIDENSVELTLTIPESLDYFKGHFPTAPILPGVVQLHWAVKFSQKKLNLADVEVKDVEVLKFKAVIVPNQDLTLTLHKKANDKIVFSYQSKKHQHASGRIVFKSSL